MELTKSQERRLSFVASLLSLNPNDPTDRIKALRHLNLDEEGCFHGFQYSQGNLEFFIFLDESTPLERVVTNLTQDLKQLRVALCRTSEPKNPFFAPRFLLYYTKKQKNGFFVDFLLTKREIRCIM